jgi:serine phosphatase RsbU (regulator of sigma subunit)
MDATLAKAPSPAQDTPDEATSLGAPSPGARLQDESFEAYRETLVHHWARTLTLLGLFLIPLFTLLDYFTMPPELLVRFAGYRTFGTAFSLVEYFVLRRTRPSKYSVLHGYAFTLMVGGMIVRMTADLGGFDSSYYAGLTLVIVAVNLVLPWRAIHTAINGWLVVAMYLALNLSVGDPFHTPLLINNLYFLSSTVVIAVAISYLKHSLIEREFRLRAELLELNDTLDRSREELKTARDALWGEMEVAKRIQTALLPASRRLGAYEVAAVMHPADEVGGDYYELFESRVGEQWVAIGDVSGHGVESGLVMMMTQTSLLSMVNEVPGRLPSEVFCGVNGVFCENVARLQASRFMTLNIVRMHEDRLVLAGKHQDILVHRRRSGRVEVVSNEGSWLGVLRDLAGRIGDLTLPIEPGDTVLFFTDGVTEATGADGEMFGQQRLEQLFAQLATLPLPELLARIEAAIRAFQPKPQDDVTLMLLRRDPA